MPNPPAGRQTDVLLRLSVPTAGELRAVATEVAAKVAEYCGASAPEAETLGAALERAVSALSGGPGPVDLVFRRSGGDLVVEARANGQTSEVRHALPA
jgi:hypothetical protein